MVRQTPFHCTSRARRDRSRRAATQQRPVASASRCDSAALPDLLLRQQHPHPRRRRYNSQQ
eukprot:455157-Prymnesium_polylepis.1